MAQIARDLSSSSTTCISLRQSARVHSLSARPKDPSLHLCQNGSACGNSSRRSNRQTDTRAFVHLFTRCPKTFSMVIAARIQSLSFIKRARSASNFTKTRTIWLTSNCKSNCLKATSSATSISMEFKASSTTTYLRVKQITVIIRT